MARLTLILPDGSRKEVEGGGTILDLLEAHAPEWLNEALLASVDGQPWDLFRPAPEGAVVRILTFRHDDAKQALWHTASHILAQAVKELWPEAKLGIGPPIAEGFYYDFDVPRPFTPEDLERIEERMREIVRRDLPIERMVLSKGEAKRLFAERGETYKLELLEEIPEGEVTVYKQGEFVDLCKGPHVPRTGLVRAFKLLSVSGAYWRGDERNPMLQRVYGIAFPERGMLEDYLRKLEEARRRDHRRLGTQLGLYEIEEEVGPGLVLWHPKGAKVRRIIEQFWIEEHERRGYKIVYTPHIAKVGLWKRSGHTELYSEFMFPPMDCEGQEYIVKPMNCPFHIMIYKSRARSYRDLPLRLAELGTVYRYERSGVLHGLMRVRGFTQDDAHIFCTPEQVVEEIRGVIDLVLFMMRKFGFSDLRFYLSTRPDKFAGSPEEWEKAEEALARVMEEMDIKYEVDPGGGVFYGPKIDVKIADALGRLWQGPTVQFDFNLPERFDLTYMGPDGNWHRPVMIHRAILGSLERFMGVLIEHYAGALPVWLCPEQVRILPIADRHLPRAREVLRRLLSEGIRSTLDDRHEKTSVKVAEAEAEKVPYMLIIGDREVATGKVSVRERGRKDLGPMGLDEFVELVRRG